MFFKALKVCFCLGCYFVLGTPGVGERILEVGFDRTYTSNCLSKASEQETRLNFFLKFFLLFLNFLPVCFWFHQWGHVLKCGRVKMLWFNIGLSEGSLSTEKGTYNCCSKFCLTIKGHGVFVLMEELFLII